MSASQEWKTVNLSLVCLWFALLYVLNILSRCLSTKKNNRITFQELTLQTAKFPIVHVAFIIVNINNHEAY